VNQSKKRVGGWQGKSNGGRRWSVVSGVPALTAMVVGREHRQPLGLPSCYRSLPLLRQALYTSSRHSSSRQTSTAL
jgi:hypothetical protein